MKKKKRRAPADRTAAQRVASQKSRYESAGLVRIDTWVPQADALAILRRCQQLRDIYLGRVRECERCQFVGRFIDGGETCPKCKLVQ